jgi:hypothetical protein
MDDRERLAFYPFVVVRIACRVCSRHGAYRLARLAAKFGPEIGLRDLLDRFSYDAGRDALPEGRGDRQQGRRAPERGGSPLSQCDLRHISHDELWFNRLIRWTGA